MVKSQDTIGSFRQLNNHLAYSQNIVEQKWKYITGDFVYSIILADINVDNLEEIILCSDDRKVQCLRWNGELEWVYQCPARPKSIAVIDINNDGMMEVILGLETGGLQILSSIGEIIDTIPILKKISCLHTIDNSDGFSEIIVGTEEGELLFYDHKFSLTQTLVFHDGIRAIDSSEFNNKGDVEVVLVTNESIIIINKLGNELWSNSSIKNGNDLIIADINDDGKKEIVICTNDGQLAVFDSFGKQVWNIKLSRGLTSICIGDVDNDSFPEILVGGYDQNLYIVTAQGKLKWIESFVDWVLDVKVLSLDKNSEILLGLGDSSLTVLKFNNPENLLPDIVSNAISLETSLDLLSTLDLRSRNILRTVTMGRIDLVNPHIESHSLRKYKTLLDNGLYEEALEHLLQIETLPFSFSWEHPIGGVGTWLFRTDSFVDIKKNISYVATGTPDGRLVLLNNNGDFLWEFQTQGWCLCEKIALLDEISILAGSSDKFVYAFGIAGNELWRKEFPDRVWVLECQDLNNDGYDEIIVGLDNGQIFILDKLGDVINKGNIDGGLRSIACRVIDNKGYELLVSSTNSEIYLLDSFLSIKNKFKTDGWAYRVTIQDLNGDGIPEFLIAGREKSFQVYSYKGYLLWEYPVNDWIKDFAVEDIDNDDRLEIIIVSHDGYLYCLNDIGELLHEYKVAHALRSISIMQDVPGRFLLILGTGDGRLISLEVVSNNYLQDNILDCWKRIIGKKRNLVTSLRHKDFFLRGFGIRQYKLDENSDLEAALYLLKSATSDQGEFTGKEFTKKIVGFINNKENSNTQKRLFEKQLLEIVSHPNASVRVGLVHILAYLVDNQKLMFDMLNKLVNDSDVLVRREVALLLGSDKLDLAENKFVGLISQLSNDQSTWVRAQTAYALTRYFEQNQDSLIHYYYLLIEKNVSVEVICRIAKISSDIHVSGIADILCGFIQYDKKSNNLQELLRSATDLFNSLKHLLYGEAIYQNYNLLNNAIRCDSFEAIAGLSQEGHIRLNNAINYVQVFGQHGDFYDVLVPFIDLALRIVGESDIEKLLSSCLEFSSLISTNSRLLSDLSDNPEAVLIFECLQKWDALVQETLKKTKEKADVKCELVSELNHRDNPVNIKFKVSNVGEGTARNVYIELLPSNDFSVNQNSVISIIELSKGDETQVVYNINLREYKDLTPILRIRYSDKIESTHETYFSALVKFIDVPDTFVVINPNPYIVGRPLKSTEMFFGREDIFRKLEQNLLGKYQNNIIILQGPRRMGKTSILLQIDRIFNKTHVPVLIDMQGRTERGMNSFLYSLSFLIRAAINRQENSNMPELTEKDFSSRAPLFFMHEFIPATVNYLGNKKLLLMFDEFEEFEDRVNKGFLPGTIFNYIRSLVQQQSDVDFIFSGTRRIDQLSKNYWSVFFNIALYIDVGILDSVSTHKLITSPVNPYNMFYESTASDYVYTITNGHPYFLQLLCREIVNYHNDKKINFITVSDIDLILNKVLMLGEPHFMYLWERPSELERLLLLVLSGKPNIGHSLTMNQIISEIDRKEYNFREKDVFETLTRLTDEQILSKSGNKYSYQVPLFARWIKENKDFSDIK